MCFTLHSFFLCRFLLDKLMKFNQKNRIASKKSTALSAIDGSAKGVFKASGSMSFTGTTSVPLPPAPPPLVPVANVTTAGSDGQGNVSGAGSTVSKTTKSCLSALLAAHTNDKKDLAQSSVEQEKRVSVTIPGSESTLKDQRSLKPPGSGQSSSVSSSSEGECEAEDATAVLGGDTESKTKGIAHQEHVNCIQCVFVWVWLLTGSKRKVGSKVRRLHPIPLNDDG